MAGNHQWRASQPAGRLRFSEDPYLALWGSPETNPELRHAVIEKQQFSRGIFTEYLLLHRGS